VIAAIEPSMEDYKPPTDSSEQFSARSASALRELQERAQAALMASRDQAVHLEAQIARQIEEIAGALEEQATSDAKEASGFDGAQAEIERLTQELESWRTTWQAERAALESERDKLLDEAARTLPLAEELETSRAGWAADKAALEVERADLREQVARLESRLADADKTCAGWLDEQSGLEAERKNLAEKVTSLKARCEEAEKSRDQLRAEKSAVEQERASLADKLVQLDGAMGESEASRAAWLAERAILEAKRDELQENLADLQRERDLLAAERDAWHAERPAAENERLELLEKVRQLEGRCQDSQSSQEASQEQRLTIEAERNQLAETVSRLEARQRKSQDEWRDQLLEFEGRLRQQQASWNEQRTEWAEVRTTLTRERDEMQQKFELALVDVQRLRGRVAELEQELARRPEINQVDSAELVALRAERDALSERVEQLEQRPAAPMDANVQQDMADLQRRFELAVEDVRDLKTKNARLESQLAEAGSKAALPSDGDSMDWESQKRRLLAMLEGDGDATNDPVREKERATIEGTIEMTDAVVAEKDREIAELRAQLAGGAEAVASDVDAERDRKVNELVDADAVITEHRQRIAELERDLEGKLREAELELSVERAKLARQKVELDELRVQVDAERQLYEPNAPPGAPRRRWRTKLGLGGDES
jgi:chromosome segregation ATPase